ncbi:hypothetical protein Ancab_028297, partial [Ancistrocladus abbreviatus]
NQNLRVYKLKGPQRSPTCRKCQMMKAKRSKSLSSVAEPVASRSGGLGTAKTEAMCNSVVGGSIRDSSIQNMNTIFLEKLDSGMAEEFGS